MPAARKGEARVDRVRAWLRRQGEVDADAAKLMFGPRAMSDLNHLSFISREVEALGGGRYRWKR